MFLCVVELLALRSGHAYQAAHLNHHARFPHRDDIEATAARRSWLNELFQTRAFRGTVASIVAMGHLYHLEHHLYPSVPHHNWPELARRLNPHFERAGVKPVTILF